MKKTGKTVYVSGAVNHEDIMSDGTLTNPQAYDRGLIPIFESERPNYGYIIRYVSQFPSPSQTESTIPYLVTTYSRRDCLALKNDPDQASAQAQVNAILGVGIGIHPAANDRVVATVRAAGDELTTGATIKADALIVQSLSLGIDSNKGLATYYIEMDEYILSDDELVLALLSESDMNAGNFEVANL